MFVPLRGTPRWRFHTELCKFQSNVSADNSTTEYRTDLRLGEVVWLCILYNITNSWLLSSIGFDFNILWRNSENQELYMHKLSILTGNFHIYLIVLIINDQGLVTYSQGEKFLAMKEKSYVMEIS